jgi:hypothetical protein
MHRLILLGAALVAALATSAAAFASGNVYVHVNKCGYPCTNFAGAQVQLYQNGSYVTTTTADANGNATIFRVPAGSGYDVRAGGCVSHNYFYGDTPFTMPIGNINEGVTATARFGC